MAAQLVLDVGETRSADELDRIADRIERHVIGPARQRQLIAVADTASSEAARLRALADLRRGNGEQ